MYRKGLEPSAKARYLEKKMAMIGGENLYELGIQMIKLLPAITNPDIMNYLLFTPSPYTVNCMPCGPLQFKLFPPYYFYGQKCYTHYNSCTRGKNNNSQVPDKLNIRHLLCMSTNMV